MQPPQHRIIIIGGGIGGAALCLGLRQAGLNPALFEARSLSSTQIGGCYVLWYAGVKSLARLGLAERAHEVGNPVRRLEMCDEVGRILFSRDVGSRGDDLGGVPVAVRRVDLLTALYDQLDDDDLHLESTLRDFDQDERGITASFTDGREVRGAAMVGADGLQSTVRAHLHGMGPARHPGYAHWFGIADHVDGLPDGVFRIMHGDGARFAFFSLGGGQACWWCVRNSGRDRSGDILGSRAALEALTHNWHPLAGALVDATPEGRIQRRDTFERAPSRRWGDRRVALLGDAAHAMTFDLGQGAGTALTDAVTLTDYLARGQGLLASLRRYETDRRRVTRPLVWASSKIGGAAGWRSTTGKKFNSLILQTVGSKVTPALLERDALSHQLLGPPTNGHARTAPSDPTEGTVP